MGKNYIYSDLSVKNALVLDIEGTQYEVSQMSMSWAANEVPTAVCMLAVGRDVRTQQPAKIHSAASHQHMKKAKITFNPQKEYSLSAQWPGQATIFDGFFVGFAYRKISGKVCVVANLIHWLAALTFSSCLNKASHVSNPTSLAAAAVTSALGAGGGEGCFVSDLVGAQIAGDAVAADLWKAISKIFCEFAKIETMPPAQEGECAGDGDLATNQGALEALQKIEGSDCGGAGKYYKPLAIQDSFGELTDGIAKALGTEMVESYATFSFWDKLIGQFCPSYGMAVVPRVDSAVVVADTPAYNGGVWKELEPDEYDSFDMTAELSRPLQAVVVIAGWESQTLEGQQEPTASPLIGGCYASDAVKPGDGLRMYIAPPPWLRNLHMLSAYAGHSSGVSQNAPSKTGTTPNATPPDPDKRTPGAFGQQANGFYDKYAHTFFVNQMLRGRSGSVSGKLRFDICPLSIIEVLPSFEQHIGGEDQLAVTVYGCVQRVSIAINAEAAMAGTTLVLSHLRTSEENSSARTSAAQHPLFGAAVFEGAPLVDKYDL